jgi:hypothetical protein
MIKLQEINDIIVKPIITKKVDDKDEMFNGYFNLAVIAKKNSGKSVIVGNILKRYAKKGTNVWIFSSTISRDPTYEKILTFVKGHVETFNHFIDEDKNNVLEEILGQLRDSGSDSNNIIVFDDMSTLLRHKSVDMLLKSNRHYQCRVVIACHSVTDLTPSSRKMLDYALLFKGFNEDKLESIYNDLDVSIDYDTFKDIYDIVTEKPYSFLYVNTRTDELRSNFNKKIIIT